MSGERLWRNRSVGARTMKITVVGAVLIIAGALLVVLVFRALAENKDRGPEQGPA